MHSRVLCLSSLVAACLTLTACNINSWVYRPDVHQGNLVTKEMTDQLTVGMTKAQVQFVMGEALIRDQLHTNRWDYTYYVNPRKGEIQTRRVTLYFDDADRLQKVESKPLPTEMQADRMILNLPTDYQEAKAD